MSQQSTQSSISPLRRRMLEDMAMRGLREETQRDYIRFVRSFAAFLGRSPDAATAEDIRRFQVHQAESGVQPPTINCSVSALRFFFTVTLDRPDLSRRLVLVRHPRKLPECAERRGGRAAARGGAGFEVQGGSRHSLWRRTARVGGDRPQGGRHRQHAHADPGRAGERPQGPQRNAVAAVAGAASAVVARGQAP